MKTPEEVQAEALKNQNKKEEEEMPCEEGTVLRYYPYESTDEHYTAIVTEGRLKTYNTYYNSINDWRRSLPNGGRNPLYMNMYR
jgi:hypothetical protein